MESSDLVGIGMGGIGPGHSVAFLVVNRVSLMSFPFIQSVKSNGQSVRNLLTISHRSRVSVDISGCRYRRPQEQDWRGADGGLALQGHLNGRQVPGLKASA